MAAILFVDVVKYSELPDHLQRQVAQGLNEECVKYLIPAFRYQRMNAPNKTVIAAMPTGDGVVVCAEETSEILNPGLFLLDLAFDLQSWGRSFGKKLLPSQEIRFRIGLHSGKLLSIEDVNQHRNFCGRDINIAQRIMDCGDADHILCSMEAHDKHFRSLPLDYSTVHFMKLDDHYKIKHGEKIRLCNIVRKNEFGLENGKIEAPIVQWKYHILPYKKTINTFGFFGHCRHLTIVGVTNDQVVHELRRDLESQSGHSFLQKLEQIDIYYADEKILEHLPSEEKVFVAPDAVGGNPKRDQETLINEQISSKATISDIKLQLPKSVTINLWKYQIPPMAGIIAGDVGEAHGSIQVTHYIWGRMSGSCPTMVLTRTSLEEVYHVYADYLVFLKAVSTPWDCF